MKNLKKLFRVVFKTILLLALFFCSENPTNNNNNNCPPIDIGIVPQPPYNNPIWHPSGKFIGFNYTPLDSISYPYGKNCIGNQHFNYDSSGFWLVNTDGTNKRRILQHQLFLADWSPDGKWIAFVMNAQIYKMPFNINEEKFDTTRIEQLTFEGRNFLPAWGPDGEWIAYNRSICDGLNTCGIWIMTSSGMNHRFLADYGNYPVWQLSGSRILFQTRAITQNGQPVGDSLWIFDVRRSIRSFHIFLAGNNRNFRYSVDGTMIAFCSNNDIWLMDTTGVNLRQITTNGVDVDFGLPFSSSPDGEKIVYTQYNFKKWNYDNGVLWIININTGIKYQLTFNNEKR